MTGSSVPPGSNPPGDRLGGSEPKDLRLRDITDENDPRLAELREIGRQGPDGPDEHLFRLLEDDEPDLAQRLKNHYVERWIAQARLRPPSLQEAIDTVELKVAPDGRARQTAAAAYFLLHREHLLALRLGRLPGDSARLHGGGSGAPGVERRRGS